MQPLYSVLSQVFNHSSELNVYELHYQSGGATEVFSDMVNIPPNMHNSSAESQDRNFEKCPALLSFAGHNFTLLR